MKKILSSIFIIGAIFMCFSITTFAADNEPEHIANTINNGKFKYYKNHTIDNTTEQSAFVNNDSDAVAVIKLAPMWATRKGSGDTLDYLYTTSKTEYNTALEKAGYSVWQDYDFSGVRWFMYASNLCGHNTIINRIQNPSTGKHLVSIATKESIYTKFEGNMGVYTFPTNSNLTTQTVGSNSIVRSKYDTNGGTNSNMVGISRLHMMKYALAHCCLPKGSMHYRGATKNGEWKDDGVIMFGTTPANASSI